MARIPMRTFPSLCVVVAACAAVSCHVRPPRPDYSSLKLRADPQLPETIRDPIDRVISVVNDALEACKRNAGTDRRSRCVGEHCIQGMYEVIGARVRTAERAINLFSAAYERYRDALRTARPLPDPCAQTRTATRATDAGADAKRALHHLGAALEDLESDSDACRESGATLPQGQRNVNEDQRRALPRLLAALDTLDDELRTKRAGSCSAAATAATTVETTTSTKIETSTTTKRNAAAKPTEAPADLGLPR